MSLKKWAKGQGQDYCLVGAETRREEEAAEVNTWTTGEIS